MRISIGDIIASDFGKGPIVALTDEWMIYTNEDGAEIAIEKTGTYWWIAVDEFGPNSSKYETTEINEKP